MSNWCNEWQLRFVILCTQWRSSWKMSDFCLKAHPMPIPRVTLSLWEIRLQKMSGKDISPYSKLLITKNDFPLIIDTTSIISLHIPKRHILPSRCLVSILMPRPSIPLCLSQWWRNIRWMPNILSCGDAASLNLLYCTKLWWRKTLERVGLEVKCLPKILSTSIRRNLKISFPPRHDIMLVSAMH